ncbi:hypothetical protein ACFL6G_01345 [candidate division KSB1 bacterium]
MLDEIGREYLLGWETAGEWIILYVFLIIQLIYNSMFLLKLPVVLRQQADHNSLLNLQNSGS